MRISSYRITSSLLACGIWITIFNLPADAIPTNALGAWAYIAQTAEDGALNRVTAGVKGEGGSALWLTCTRIAKEEDEPLQMALAATITQKAYLGPSDPRGRSTVYWIDGQPPELSYWIYRDRYGQLREQEQVKSFVASLTTAKSLIVDLANYRLEQQSVVFSLNPVETKVIVERFARDCQAIGVVKDYTN